jgi:RNA polymerase sigma-70 factor (ECF subfamily)
MLGSLSEADDAVQDAWLRVSRAETSEVDDLGAWLTTIVARVCLNNVDAEGPARDHAEGVRNGPGRCAARWLRGPHRTG